MKLLHTHTHICYTKSRKEVLMYVKDKKTNIVYKATQKSSRESNVAEPQSFETPGFELESADTLIWIPAYKLMSEFKSLTTVEVESSVALYTHLNPAPEPEPTPLIILSALESLQELTATAWVKFTQVPDTYAITVTNTGTEAALVLNTDYTLVEDAVDPEDGSVIVNISFLTLAYNTEYTISATATKDEEEAAAEVTFKTVVEPELTMTSSPEPNNNAVALDSDIVLTFSNEISTHGIVIKISDLVQEGFTATLDATDKILTVSKEGNLMSFATHTVEVTVTDIYGQVLETSFDFTTVSE